MPQNEDAPAQERGGEPVHVGILLHEILARLPQRAREERAREERAREGGPVPAAEPSRPNADADEQGGHLAVLERLIQLGDTVALDRLDELEARSKSFEARRAALLAAFEGIELLLEKAFSVRFELRLAIATLGAIHGQALADLPLPERMDVLQRLASIRRPGAQRVKRDLEGVLRSRKEDERSDRDALRALQRERQRKLRTNPEACS